jgi:hypothetical protein
MESSAEVRERKTPPELLTKPPRKRQTAKPPSEPSTTKSYGMMPMNKKKINTEQA